MSNPKLQFAEDVSRFVSMLGGLAAYGAEIGQIGSLEQAREQAETAAAKAREELAALQGQVEQKRSETKAECDYMRETADRYASVAKAKADSSSRAAEQTAADTIARANADAAAIVAAAEKEKGGLASRIEQAKAELGTVNIARADKEAELRRIESNIAVAQRDHDAVTAAHAEFLKSIGAK